jgi:hypothetical protein
MPSSSAAPSAAALTAFSLLILLSGCSGVVSVPEASEESPRSLALTQRIVVIVHGDASYLYHAPDGTAHEADKETLREAFAAARSLPQAEVFIFHQRPNDPLFGLFPRDDGTLYHFRHGRLLRQTTYDQDRRTPLGAEASLLRAHRTPVPDTSLFTAALYYGHAVPERPRPGYHRSRAPIPFGMEQLAGGLERLSPSTPFDALVLSTCDSGTPSSIATLAPHARSVVASPGDLHLSFVDADLLPSLSKTSTPEDWTQQFAEQAFNRLTERVTTAVTLATYDLERAAPIARRLAQQVVPDTSTSPTGARHADCRRVLDAPVDTSGVRVWHRPARFGPHADRDTHSGWGCVSSSP